VSGSEGPRKREELLRIRNLHVSFRTYGGWVRAVRGIDLSVREGECLAVVGESGCGKSVTAHSVLRLIPSPPAEIRGTLEFEGADLAKLSMREMRRIRGCRIGMIFQDPMTSLDPTMTAGKQILEAVREHGGVSKAVGERRVLEVLDLVGIPNPERAYRNYPHELSGGMRQRIVIAMAVSCSPRLLVADEPTTALDVTTQAQILELIRDLQARLSTSVVLITHDIGVVAQMAERVAVFYAGQVVEEGPVEEIFREPGHPYTRALLRSRPKEGRRGERLLSIPGSPPDLFAPPPGCGFAPRCDCAMKICELAAPERFPLGEEHFASCWLHHERARAAERGGIRRAESR
jgi:oligopeptide/dipeptide ABC transporter ATP-binding protein